MYKYAMHTRLVTKSCLSFYSLFYLSLFKHTHTHILKLSQSWNGMISAYLMRLLIETFTGPSKIFSIFFLYFKANKFPSWIG